MPPDRCSWQAVVSRRPEVHSCRALDLHSLLPREGDEGDGAGSPRGGIKGPPGQRMLVGRPWPRPNDPATRLIFLLRGQGGLAPVSLEPELEHGGFERRGLGARAWRAPPARSANRMQCNPPMAREHKVGSVLGRGRRMLVSPLTLVAVGACDGGQQPQGRAGMRHAALEGGLPGACVAVRRRVLRAAGGCSRGIATPHGHVCLCAGGRCGPVSDVSRPSTGMVSWHCWQTFLKVRGPASAAVHRRQVAKCRPRASWRALASSQPTTQRALAPLPPAQREAARSVPLHRWRLPEINNSSRDARRGRAGR